MSKNTIALAKWGMQPQLTNLWMECFEDTPRGTKYFFNNAFQPRECLVYLADGDLAAAVYLLPAELSFQGKSITAHYIYAAGTRKKYRSRGYMRALLNCAAYLGTRRGEGYSFLLPANEGLYQYYAANGYIPYFRQRVVRFSRDEIYQEGASSSYWKVLPDYTKMAQLRAEYLFPNSGSVLWSPKALAYAAGIQRIYGGKLLCIQGKGGFAYALCRKLGDGSCEVVECMCSEEAFSALATLICQEFPADFYQFRLPCGGLCSGKGEPSWFGMVKPLNDTMQENLLAMSKDPFLGLPLD